MKLYIFEDVWNLTDNYHSSGAYVVITDGDPFEIIYKSRNDDEALEFAEDLVWVIDTDQTEENLFAFPDAGCC